MDQDLAMDSHEYNATVQVSYVYPKPKRGVFMFFKTRSLKRKVSLARLPPRRGNVLTKYDGDKGLLGNLAAQPFHFLMYLNI